MRGHQSGTAIIYILIAVVLFAALGYVFSLGARSSAETIMEEEAQVMAQDLMSYAARLDRGVQRVFSRRCSENQISFERPPFDGSDTDYVNPDAPADFSCHVFHPQGGNISEPTITRRAFDETLSYSHAGRFVYSGHTCVSGMGNGDSGCSGDSAPNEELMILAAGVKREVCLAINQRLQIENPAGEPPETAGNIFSSAAENRDFKGIFDDGGLINIAGQEGPSSACILQSSGAHAPSGTYSFYHVLLAR